MGILRVGDYVLVKSYDLKREQGRLKAKSYYTRMKITKIIKNGCECDNGNFKFSINDIGRKVFKIGDSYGN